MRKEIVGNDKVFIGRLGDDDVREFAFDLSEYVSCMDGEFSVSCLFVLPSKSDSEAYAIAIDHYRLEGNQLIWIPTNAECSETGWGKFEAILYNNDQQVATLIWRVQIGKSLVGDEEPPTGWENYILAVEKLVDEIENMTVSASVDANVGTPSVTVETSGGQGEPFSIDFEFHNLKGGQGEQGVGIASISIAEKSASGLDVVYTLTATKTDGTTTASDFTVRNGNGIASAVLNDDYTLTLYFDDGTHYTTPSIRGEQGEQGIQGVGVSTITATKTSTVGLVDTYTMTITLTNGNTQTVQFTVTNGQDAELSDNLPLMDGTADAGTDTEASRSDHVHPSDTSKADIDGSYEDLGCGKLILKSIKTDNAPYLSRPSFSGDREIDKLVGGTVAWNQMIGVGYPAACTATETDGVITITPTGSGNRYIGIWSTQTNYQPLDANHVYLQTVIIRSDGEHDVGFQNYLATGGFKKTTSATFVNLSEIFKQNTKNNVIIQLYSGSRTVYYIKSGSFMLFDLTQMFGSAIADYVYSLEQNTEGSGLAWLQSYGFFTEDYIPYDAGTLKSVEATAHIMKDADDNVIGNYPLDDIVLRGIPKLDAGNHLYYDGDTYEEDGTVTRKYGIVDLGTLGAWMEYSGYPGLFFLNTTPSGAKVPTSNTTLPSLIANGYIAGISRDIGTPGHTKGEIALAYNRIYISNDAYAGNVSGFKTAISGVYLVYELATPTTESADPFTNPQLVDADGTETYTTTNNVPVGHDTQYIDTEEITIPIPPDDNEYYLTISNGQASWSSVADLQTLILNP